MIKRTILIGFLGLFLLVPGSLLAEEGGASTASTSTTVASPANGARRQTENLPGQGGRSYKLFVGSELRTAAVLDEDPANDIRWEWLFGGTMELLPGFSAFGFLPLVQLFSVEEGEAPFRLQDFRMGATYFKPIPMNLGPVGTLYTKQGLSVLLPMSRESLAQDMRFALELSSRETLELFKDLTVGARGLGRYYNYGYAERNGLEGGMNTKFVTMLGGFVEYSLELPSIIPGYFSFGGGMNTQWLRKYDSASNYEAEKSSTGFWAQKYGWLTYVDYTPLKYVTVSLGYEHGGGVLKNGIPMYGTFDTFVNSIADRDRTEFFLSVMGRY